MINSINSIKQNNPKYNVNATTNTKTQPRMFQGNSKCDPSFGCVCGGILEVSFVLAAATFISKRYKVVKQWILSLCHRTKP